MSKPLDQQEQSQATTDATNTTMDGESSSGGTRDTNSGTGKTGYEAQGEEGERPGAEKKEAGSAGR